MIILDLILFRVSITLGTIRVFLKPTSHTIIAVALVRLRICLLWWLRRSPVVKVIRAIVTWLRNLGGKLKVLRLEGVTLLSGWLWRCVLIWLVSLVTLIAEIISKVELLWYCLGYLVIVTIALRSVNLCWSTKVWAGALNLRWNHRSFMHLMQCLRHCLVDKFSWELLECKSQSIVLK
jgi:hypothetical protein